MTWKSSQDLDLPTRQPQDRSSNFLRTQLANAVPHATLSFQHGCEDCGHVVCTDCSNQDGMTHQALCKSAQRLLPKLEQEQEILARHGARAPNTRVFRARIGPLCGDWADESGAAAKARSDLERNSGGARNAPLSRWQKTNQHTDKRLNAEMPIRSVPALYFAKR